MLKNIVTATEGDVKIDLAEERVQINKVLIVVITSDKGLCGGFNTNVIKKAKEAIKDYQSQANAGNVTVMTVGKKGNDAFKRNKEVTLNTEYLDLFKDLSFDNSVEAIEYILESYKSGEYDKVIVCYSQFKNAVLQFFKKVDFLPIPKIVGEAEPDKGPKNTNKEEAAGSSTDYIFEPDKHVLIQELAPKILKTQFYSYLLDSNASEHGARMTAMDNATENANEILRDLKIAYNKARQASITTELTEIVSGAAALEG